MARPRGAGRRPGDSTTRADLLDAARAEFAARGYSKATVRAIATRAGVDAAMINHHFGSKSGLFAAAVEMPFDPAQYIDDVLAGPTEDLGARLATTFLTLWDDAGQVAATSTMRTAMHDPAAAEQLKAFLIDGALRKGFTRRFGWNAQSGWRISLVSSQLMGMIAARYILGVEPLASAPRAAVAAAMAPALQHYITGDVGDPDTPDDQADHRAEHQTDRRVDH